MLVCCLFSIRALFCEFTYLVYREMHYHKNITSRGGRVSESVQNQVHTTDFVRQQEKSAVIL